MYMQAPLEFFFDVIKGMLICVSIKLCENFENNAVSEVRVLEAHVGSLTGTVKQVSRRPRDCSAHPLSNTATPTPADTTCTCIINR